MTNRYSKTIQFWDWFTRHKEAYTNVHTLDKNEFRYRMRELDMHLTAYGKNIQVLFYEPLEKKEVPVRVVFTAGGRTKLFGKIERLVAKAPQWPGWEFIALEPPRPIDFFIQQDFGDLGFEPVHCWFDPADLRDPRGHAFLIVYADTYGTITDDWHAAAAATAYNVLGEKTYGSNIGCVECHRLCDLTKKEREKLLPLAKLPQYCRVSGSHSAWHVDHQGLVKK